MCVCFASLILHFELSKEIDLKYSYDFIKLAKAYKVLRKKEKELDLKN